MSHTQVSGKIRAAPEGESKLYDAAPSPIAAKKAK